MAKGKKAAIAEFSTNEWSGVLHFQCGACSFDTFQLGDMLNHLVNVHDSETALAELLSKEEEVKNAQNNVG